LVNALVPATEFVIQEGEVIPTRKCLIDDVGGAAVLLVP
jgi:hypothetical protein